MGQVTTTVIERGSDGRIGVIGQSSRSGLGGASPMGGSFSGDLDFASWTGDQLDSLADILTRGAYAGESSFRGKPSLRYESRMERGPSQDAAAPVAARSVYDYLIDNPFVRIESQYDVFPDGRVELVRQWAMSEFGVGSCPSDGPDEARQELERVAVESYAALLESIESAQCGIFFDTEQFRREGYRREGEALPTTTMSRMTFERHGEGRWLLHGSSEQTSNGKLILRSRTKAWHAETFDPSIGEWRAMEPQLPEFAFGPNETAKLYAIDVGGLVANEEEYNILTASPDGIEGYEYAGETTVQGRPAERYEKRELDVKEEGIADLLQVREYVKDNPLLFTLRTHAILPEGELRLEDELMLAGIGH